MIRKLLLSAAALAIVPGAADAAWYQASSKHFVVYDDDSPGRVKAYTERLERFDQAIRYWHHTPEDTRGPSARVTIYVVSDIDAIQKIYGKGGENVAGFYDPRASGSVAFTPRNTGEGAAFDEGAQFGFRLSQRRVELSKSFHILAGDYLKHVDLDPSCRFDDGLLHLLKLVKC